jgi:hypothetical protein
MCSICRLLIIFIFFKLRSIFLVFALDLHGMAQASQVSPKSLSSSWKCGSVDSQIFGPRTNEAKCEPHDDSRINRFPSASPKTQSPHTATLFMSPTNQSNYFYHGHSIMSVGRDCCSPRNAKSERCFFVIWPGPETSVQRCDLASSSCHFYLPLFVESAKANNHADVSLVEWSDVTSTVCAIAYATLRSNSKLHFSPAAQVDICRK